MNDLKQISLQLQQKCSEPCKDTVEIQTTTGTGKKKKMQSIELQAIPISQEISQSFSSFVLVQCLVTD